MPSVSACVSARTFNRCTSRRRVSILFNKEHPCASDFCLKALADHSFMCHFQGCTTFMRPHDNRLVGGAEKGARRLSEWIHLRLTPGRWLSARHISGGTPRDPLPLPPACGLMVVGALVWARPVVMWDPLEVASTRDGRSIDKAGEKWGRSTGEGRFLPPCCTVLPIREGSPDCSGLENVSGFHFYCTSETFDHFSFPWSSKSNYFLQFPGCIHQFYVSSSYFNTTVCFSALVTKIFVPLVTSVWIILDHFYLQFRAIFHSTKVKSWLPPVIKQ